MSDLEKTLREMIEQEVARQLAAARPRLLGAGLVQSDESAAISANKEWRRRESNMGALSLADAARERFRRVAHDRRSTSDEERQGTAPSLVQSACDLGLALLRASAPNRRRRRAGLRAS